MKPSYSILLDGRRARTLALGLLAHVSPDNMTPALTGAAVRIEEGVPTFYATDRYHVVAIRRPAMGRVLTPSTRDTVLRPMRLVLEPKVELFIPRDALRWIAANAGAYKSSGKIMSAVALRWSTSGDESPFIEVTVKPHRDLGLVFRTTRFVTKDNTFTFPSVYKLIEQHRKDPHMADTPTVLQPKLMGDIAKATDRNVIFRATKTTGDTGRRVGPVYWATRGEFVEDLEFIEAEGLIQPMLEFGMIDEWRRDVIAHDEAAKEAAEADAAPKEA